MAGMRVLSSSRQCAEMFKAFLNVASRCVTAVSLHLLLSQQQFVRLISSWLIAVQVWVCCVLLFGVVREAVGPRLHLQLRSIAAA
jgi:hypothetical protein